VSVLTATAWAHGLAAGAGAHVAGPVPFIDAVDPGAVHVDGVELAGARPAGRRFGILVHALLAVVPFDAGADLIGRLAAVHARVLGATDEERSAAASVVERALKHRVFDEARAARAAGRACRREAPVSITVAAPAAPGSSFLIDGQIDLAYDTENGWVVVDFKTDAEIAGAEEAYRRQVALYAHAVARATGRPARGVLLRI
jgi:ATP-dependent exoDNAse (exonuclease V) beta subunit